MVLTVLSGTRQNTRLHEHSITNELDLFKKFDELKSLPVCRRTLS